MNKFADAVASKLVDLAPQTPEELKQKRKAERLIARMMEAADKTRWWEDAQAVNM